VPGSSEGDTSSTISVQSGKILGQIYPTRRMVVWSNLLSCEELIRFSVAPMVAIFFYVRGMVLFPPGYENCTFTYLLCFADL
jgi:hypothetical protein